MQDSIHTCQECGRRIAYGDKHTGVAVPCPGCGKETTLGKIYFPTACPNAIPSTLASSISQPSSYPPKTSGNPNRELGTIAGYVIGIAAIFSILIAVILGGSNSKTTQAGMAITPTAQSPAPAPKTQPAANISAPAAVVQPAVVTSSPPAGTPETRPAINVAAIERVLLEDARTASAKTDPVDHVTEVIQKMEAVDIDQCPPDFGKAYMAHIGAWRESQRVWREKKSLYQEYNAVKANFDEKFTSDAAIALALLAALAGEDVRPKRDAEAQRINAKYDAAFALVNERASLASAAVGSTFSTVQQIAVGYGAKLPKK